MKSSVENQFSTKKSILQELDDPALQQRGIRLLVKRDDLIHPEVSGNKWRKLKYSILQAQQMKNEGILTFGGAFSNHLLATAFACKAFGMSSVGIVRGEELNENSNHTLRRCAELGMKLVFVDRMFYQMRNDPDYQKELKIEFPFHFLVPEGGANYYGMIGCQEIWDELPEDIDHLFVAQGTTTTSCGLLLGLPETCKLHVIPVLKGFDALQEMEKLLYLATFDAELSTEMLKRVEVHNQYHGGGYAKYDETLLQFMRECKIKYNLPLDQVYTAKVFYGLLQELKNEEYNHKTLVFLHTGGLQGSVLKEIN